MRGNKSHPLLVYRSDPIRADGGTQIYSFATKYASLGVDSTRTKEDIQLDLNRQTGNPCSEQSGSLFSWADLKKQPPGLTVIPKLPKSDYDRLRESNRPMCTHSSGYERYRYIIFDPLRKKAMVIAEVHW